MHPENRGQTRGLDLGEDSNDCERQTCVAGAIARNPLVQMENIMHRKGAR